MNPTRQRRQAHRQRKALARALHAVRSLRRPYARDLRLWQRGAIKRPPRMRLAKAVRRHTRLLRRELVR